MRRTGLLTFSFLLALLMIVPVFGVVKVWPINSAVVDVLSFLLSGLLIGVCFISSKSTDFKVSTPLYFFLVLVVLLTISVFFNEYSYESAWRWYFVNLTFSLLIILAFNEIKSDERVQFNLILAKSLWFGAFIYCLASLLKYYGILSLVFSWVEASDARLSGIWYQPNLTTTVTWLGVTAGSVFYSQKNKRFFFIISLLVFGWVIASAASRMSWLMLVGLFFLIIVSRMPKFIASETTSARRLLSWSLAVIAIMLVVVPLINEPMRNFLVEINLIDRNVSVSLMDRVVTEDAARLSELSKLVSALGDFSVQQLFLGLGPGNYPAFSLSADMKLPPENLVSSIWLHSHNLFTMIFVELGVLGLLSVSVFLFFIVKNVLTRVFDLTTFLSIGCLGVIFIHSNLEFPLWYPWFLIVTCLLLVNLFHVTSVQADIRVLKPVIGGIIVISTMALVINLSYQYIRVIEVAVNPDPQEEEFRSLALLANDSLMGPYVILRKYRDFAPESINLDWQLNEARRMKAWQPRDLVLLREYSLLILKGDVDSACESAQSTAYRYPKSAPIMLEHALKSGVLNPSQAIRIANCIEQGLAPRGETIPSMQERNDHEISRM